MIDDPYRDADLVELYDLDNPGGDDHAYYRALADQIDARTIVDLGCGTGMLTRSLARSQAGPGRTVIGIDPSRTMLDYARRQPGSGSVAWIHGDAAALPATATADLAVCTGNAIMHIGPDELPSTLTSLAGALRAGGTLSRIGIQVTRDWIALRTSTEEQFVSMRFDEVLLKRVLLALEERTGHQSQFLELPKEKD